MTHSHQQSKNIVDCLPSPERYGPLTIPTMEGQTVQPPPEPTVELSDGSLLPIYTGKEFTVETIAHALAMACRFGYQCRQFYSVAQHSIVVSKLMAKFGGDPREGLFHDGAEFILGDLSTPIKYSVGDFLTLEKDLQGRINKFFGLPEGKSAECDWADKVAMFMEAYDLVPSKGATFSDPLGVRAEAIKLRSEFEIWVAPMDWYTARNWFKHTYRELT